MVPVIALLRPSLVSSLCHSFDLFFREFISSLPVPFPANFCSVDFVSFCNLPIPLPDNICLITCLLISSLPEPFPDNSVLSFVWICLVLIHACPRLRLLPAPPVPQYLDSRFRPTPVHWTSDWITLIATVCQRTILDCCFSLDEYFNKEHLFFAPEFCLAIGSSYRILTVVENNAITLRQIQRKIIETNEIFQNIDRTLDRVLRKNNLRMKQVYRVPFEGNSERVKELRYNYVQVSPIQSHN